MNAAPQHLGEPTPLPSAHVRCQGDAVYVDRLRAVDAAVVDYYVAMDALDDGIIECCSVDDVTPAFASLKIGLVLRFR